MIIGVIGTLGAGKGTVASYIARKKGFKHISMSKVLRFEAKKLGYKFDRTSLQKAGNLFAEKNGYLAGKIAERMEKYGIKDAVVEGIRIVPDIKKLKKSTDRFVLISVDAPVKTRYERVMKRGNIEDKGVGFAEFKREDEKELRGDWPGQQTGKCIKLADYKVENSGTKKELYEKVDKILRKIR
jgi:dephospho-CoA kinase